ncbi:MAG: aldehyde dehydrogenase family protein [Pseudorhizobium sp.]
MTIDTQKDAFPGVAAALAWIGAAPKKNLIGDTWRDALSGDVLGTPDPATGEELARIANAGPEDVDLAVRAAREAYDTVWRTMDPYVREGHLLKIADVLEAHAEELAIIQSLDMGTLLDISRMLISSAVTSFRYYAGWVTKIAGHTLPMRGDQITYTRRQSLGVVGAIIPWNGPALATAWKIAPAIACGNTVVFKPASEAPLVSIRMVELMLEAGLPTGVVNLVNGAGKTGAAIVDHPGVDKVTFTGSTATGQSILRASADTMKKVTLELGGKSPTIIMADADLDQAIPAALIGFTAGAGQGCVAGTRIFVHESIHDEVVSALAEQVKALKVGSAFDPESQIPPIVSKNQLDKVLGYIEAGEREGAVAHRSALSTQAGFFAMPTLFTQARPDMSIVREEIFGPVAAVMTFSDEAGAIQAANDTSYGLSANIWTRDLGAAHRLSDRTNAGIVWVNTIFELDHMAPFGGFKMSGLGRELGAESIDAYTQTKTVVMRY